jgi:hypothetical protein
MGCIRDGMLIVHENKLGVTKNALFLVKILSMILLRKGK